MGQARKAGRKTSPAAENTAACREQPRPRLQRHPAIAGSPLRIWSLPAEFCCEPQFYMEDSKSQVFRGSWAPSSQVQSADVRLSVKVLIQRIQKAMHVPTLSGRGPPPTLCFATLGPGACKAVFLRCQAGWVSGSRRGEAGRGRPAGGEASGEAGRGRRDMLPPTSCQSHLATAPHPAVAVAPSSHSWF